MATIDLSSLSVGNQPVIAGLKKAVAQSYALLAAAHNAHVGITGPDFFPLHEVLGDIYEGALGDADKWAERLRALGSDCHICLTELDSASGLPCPPKPPFASAQEVIASIVEIHAVIIRDLTGLMNTADNSGDKVTANMLQDAVAAFQKKNWMLKSYLKS